MTPKILINKNMVESLHKENSTTPPLLNPNKKSKSKNPRDLDLVANFHFQLANFHSWIFQSEHFLSALALAIVEALRGIPAKTEAGGQSSPKIVMMLLWMIKKKVASGTVYSNPYHP